MTFAEEASLEDGTINANYDDDEALDAVENGATVCKQLLVRLKILVTEVPFKQNIIIFLKLFIRKKIYYKVDFYVPNMRHVTCAEVISSIVFS